jgi:hypothetical protein
MMRLKYNRLVKCVGFIRNSWLASALALIRLQLAIR